MRVIRRHIHISSSIARSESATASTHNDYRICIAAKLTALSSRAQASGISCSAGQQHSALERTCCRLNTEKHSININRARVKSGTAARGMWQGMTGNASAKPIHGHSAETDGMIME